MASPLCETPGTILKAVAGARCADTFASVRSRLRAAGSDSPSTSAGCASTRWLALRLAAARRTTPSPPVSPV